MRETVRGSPGSPITTEDVAAKAGELVAPVPGADKCAGLIDKMALDRTGGEIRSSADAGSVVTTFISKLPKGTRQDPVHAVRGGLV